MTTVTTIAKDQSVIDIEPDSAIDEPAEQFGPSESGVRNDQFLGFDVFGFESRGQKKMAVLTVEEA